MMADRPRRARADRRPHARALRRRRRGVLGRHARPRRQPEHRRAAAPHRGRRRRSRSSTSAAGRAATSRRFRALGHGRSGSTARRASPRWRAPHSGCEVLAAGLPRARPARRALRRRVRQRRRCSTSRRRSCRACCGELHATLKPGGVLFSSNPRGDDEEGWNGGRYGAYPRPASLAALRHRRPASSSSSTTTARRPAARAAAVAGERLAQARRAALSRPQGALMRSMPPRVRT